jgi:mycothiol synthase
MRGAMLCVPSPAIRLADTLTEGQRSEVDGVRLRAAAADGVGALSEQTVLALRAGSGDVRHVLAYAAERLVGYAQLDGRAADASAELVVDPAHRRQGAGGGLLDAVLTAADEARVWAHGDLDAARALAADRGLRPVRELHKMARPLSPEDVDSPAAALPEGYAARSFVPGQDDRAWVATNAAAFAHHPEQGRVTEADLAERMAQPWFDAAGFIVVTARERPEEVAAFHWTKVDPEQRATVDPTRPAGEVYVVGVHPDHQGRGLGRPLTALGLSHLAALGLPEVVLYVDGDNHAAIHTYSGLGFTSIMVDVMYSRAVHPSLSG